MEPTVRSEEPLQLHLPIQRDNELLRLTIADDLSVTDIERTKASG